MRRRAALLVAALAVVAVSCGSAEVSGEAADELQAHMDGLRSAVERENAEQAEAKLNELRAEARERADEGEITADRLAQIESAAAQVERFLDDLGTQPAPESEAQPEPEPQTEPEPEPQPEPEPEPAPEEDEDEGESEQEEDDQGEGAEQGEGEEGGGGPGKADEEEPGDTNGEGDQTDEAASEEETDTARATWAGRRVATPL